MVRFKNRHILVELLQPSTLSTSFTPSGRPNITEAKAQITGGDEMDLDDDEEVFVQPDIPFLLPVPPLDGQKGKLNLGDDGGSVIYRAIRTSVQEVFGDEGWGRISSSFKVVYHSPLTTLTILRVARSHYRLLWSAMTFITAINNQSVLPRIVAVSGTIKKLQNAAIVYHRTVTARITNVVKASEDGGSTGEERMKQLENSWERERQQISTLED